MSLKAKEELVKVFQKTAEGNPPDSKVFGYSEDETLSTGSLGGRNVVFVDHGNSHLFHR